MSWEMMAEFFEQYNSDFEEFIEDSENRQE